MFDEITQAHQFLYDELQGLERNLPKMPTPAREHYQPIIEELRLTVHYLAQATVSNTLDLRSITEASVHFEEFMARQTHMERSPKKSVRELYLRYSDISDVLRALTQSTLNNRG